MQTRIFRPFRNVSSCCSTSRFRALSLLLENPRPRGKTSTIFEGRVARGSGEAAKRAQALESLPAPALLARVTRARDSRFEFRACSVACVLSVDFRAKERLLAVCRTRVLHHYQTSTSNFLLATMEASLVSSLRASSGQPRDDSASGE